MYCCKVYNQGYCCSYVWYKLLAVRNARAQLKVVDAGRWRCGGQPCGVYLASTKRVRNIVLLVAAGFCWFTLSQIVYKVRVLVFDTRSSRDLPKQKWFCLFFVCWRIDSCE